MVSADLRRYRVWRDRSRYPGSSEGSDRTVVRGTIVWKSQRPV